MASSNPTPYLQYLQSPVGSLPNSVRDRIARSIDQPSALGNSFMDLGERLGYSVQDCHTLQVRCHHPTFNYSPTYALLDDYCRRNCTVGRLQYVLELMNHPSQLIIPQYFQELSLLQSRAQVPGVENSESSFCPCPGCVSSSRPSLPVPQPRMPSHPAQLPSYHSNVPPGHGPLHRAEHLQDTADQQKQISTHSTHSTQSTQSTQSMHCNTGTGHGTETTPTSSHNQPTYSINNPASLSPKSQIRQPTHSTETFPKEAQNGAVNFGVQTGNGNVRPRRSPPVGRSTRSLARAEQPCPTYNYGNHGTVPNSSRNAPSTLQTSNGLSNECEKCRLSDPDETQLLTTTMSPPRPECSLHSDVQECAHQLNQLNMNVEHRRNVPTNCVRNVNFSASSGSGTDANSSPRYRVNRTNTERKRVVCERSNSDNIHELGEQPDTCSLCRQQQQLTNQKRNTWPPEDDSVNIAYLRQSSASSEGSMYEPDRSHASGNDIEDIYSRLSFNSTSTEPSERSVDGAMGNADTDSIMEEMCELNQRNDSDWKEGNCKSKKEGHKKKCKQTKTKGSKHKFVLVTFSYNPNEDNDSHLREIIQLCTELKSVGIRVKIDMDPATFDALRLNKQDWLDRMTSEAQFVIVCLSPAYYRDTENYQQSNQPRPDDVQLNARYIFNLLRKEYHENGCLNRRMVPVLFSNSGVTTGDIPLCMKSTLVYNYPEGLGDIIRTVKGERTENYQVPY